MLRHPLPWAEADARSPSERPYVARSGVRGRCLLTHGGGAGGWLGGHFLAPFDGLVCMVAVLVVSLVDGAASASVASGLRFIDSLSKLGLYVWP
jgi:hypothetical protein